MTGRDDDSEGYEPHPGDPWHPSWKDPSATDEDADLFDVPEPEGDEDRARFFRRLLRRDAGGEEGETEDETEEQTSSVDHLYDTLRPEPESIAEAAFLEADEVVAAEVDGETLEAEVADTVAAIELTAAIDTGEIEASEIGPGEDTGEVAAVPVADVAVDEVAEVTDEIPSTASAGPAAEGEDEGIETLVAVSFEAESLPVAEVEWDLREYEAVPTGHLEAMRELEDGLLEVELDLEDAALADELFSAAVGIESAQREAGVAAAIERERVAETAAIARDGAQLDAEWARTSQQVRATAVAGAQATEVRVATSERERFEIDLRDQQLVAAAALTAAGTADAVARGSLREGSLVEESVARERSFAAAEGARSRGQLIAAQSAHHAHRARAEEDVARFVDGGAEALAIEEESGRASAAVAAAADEDAELTMVATARALQARLDEERVAEERDALDRELIDASAPAFYLGATVAIPDAVASEGVAGSVEAAAEVGDDLSIGDLAPAFVVSAVAPRKRRWWQRLFGKDTEEAADEPQPDVEAFSGDVGSDARGAPLLEETTAMDPAALAFAGMAADPPDRTDDAADETGELDQPVLVPAEADAGFEGWLDPADEPEAAGDTDDAYAELGEDDAEGEITGWVAFAQGEDDEEPDQPSDASGEVAPVVPDEHGDAETDEVALAGTDEDEETEDVTVGDDDETPSVAVVGAAAALTDHSDTDVVDESVIDADWEVDDFVGDDPTDEHEFDEHELGDVGAAVPVGEAGDDSEDEAEADDTGELEAIAAAKAAESADSEIGDDDDTGELDIVAGAAASAAVFDFDEFTGEDYVQTATSDHADLAEAMTEAGDEPTEQVALTADMPGLESGVVSFDDVVESEDVYAGAAVSPRSDLPLRVITAVVLVGAFAASLLWRPALIALAIAVFVLAAGEFYTALMQKGFQPIALFGFLAIVGAGLGTVVWGVIAIPSSFLLAISILLLFLAVVPKRRDPMLSLGLTITVAAWIGGLGSFAFDIIAAEDYRTLVLAAVLTVAVVDIAQYFVGKAIGRHQLAPVISPKKTVEGLVGGVVVAFLVGASLHFFPPFDLASGLAFGAIVAVFAPMGDLAVSSAKRSLDLKDMGSILPGHGGLLDRIDSLIFVIPAAWALFTWLGYL